VKYGEVPKRNVLSEIWDRGIEEYFQFMDETQSLFFEGLCDTGQSTVSISIIKVKQLILHRTRVAACSEIKYTTHQDTLWEECRIFKFWTSWYLK